MKEMTVELSIGKFTVKEIAWTEVKRLRRQAKKDDDLMDYLMVQKCVTPDIDRAQYEALKPDDGYKLDTAIDHMNFVDVHFLPRSEQDLPSKKSTTT